MSHPKTKDLKPDARGVVRGIAAAFNREDVGEGVIVAADVNALRDHFGKLVGTPLDEAACVRVKISADQGAKQ